MSPRAPTIAVPALWVLLDAAGARGLATEPLAVEAGVPAHLLDRTSDAWPLDRRLPTATLHDLWAVIVRELGDPAFPLEVARRVGPDTFDLFGYLIKTSATVGEALTRVRRFAAIWTEGSSFDEAFEGSSCVVIYRHHAPPGHVGAAYATECVVAEVVAILRATAGDPVDGLAVDFAHAGPADTRAHERYFGAPVRFAHDRTAIRFDRHCHDRPLRTRDDAMVTFFERQAERVLTERATRAPLAYDVARVIVVDLADGAPRAADVARRLGLSHRTLVRRLGDEGESFERVLDTTRERLAERYLARPDLGLAQVALLLGFADQTSFQRAFRRWKGRTPRDYRQSLPADRR